MIFFLEMLGIGGVTGILSGLLGAGGGFIMVPLLNAVGMSMREAAGLSIVYVGLTSAAGTFRHAKLGTVDWILTLMVLAGATPMALLGARYTTIIPNNILELVFATVVLATTVAYLTWGRKETAFDAVPSDSGVSCSWHKRSRRKRIGTEALAYKIDLCSAAGVGAFAGALTGLLGIGGGWLKVPLFKLLLRIPLPIAIGTSLASILLPALVGGVSHWWLGNVPLEGSVPLVLAGMAGSQLGAILAVRLPRSWLELSLMSLLVIASTYMFARGLGYI